MLELPPNFKNDLGRDTALVPIVVIYKSGWDFSEFINISTNHVTLDNGTVIFKPLLLNIPSLKETLNISTRKYSINSVNLEISNYEYEGKRFSELAPDSLINANCNIYWTSPSVTDLVDATSGAFRIFAGSVRRYTHDDEKVKLVVEDRSQATLHKDLPTAELGFGDDVPDKYKGKKIPIVVGHVDRSPLVSGNYGGFVADSVTTSFVETIYNENGTISEVGEDNGYDGGYYDTLWMKTDSGLINVIKANQYTTDTDKIVLSLPIVPELESGSDFSDVELLCRDYNNSYVTSLSNTKTNPDWSSEDYDVPSGSLRKISDGSYESNPISWWGERHSNDFGATSGHTHKNDIILFYDNGQGALNVQFRSIFELTIVSSDYYEFLLLTLGFNFVPSYDHSGVPKIIGMKINDIDVSNILLPSNHPSNGYSGNGAIVLQTHNTGGNNIFGDNISGVSEHYAMYDTFTNVTDFAGTNAFETLTQLFNFPSSLGNNDGGENDDAAIQMGVSSSETLFVTVVNLELSMSEEFSSFINEMEFIREISAIKIFDKDFYANVNGRAMDDDDNSPTAPQAIAHILNNELGQDVVATGTYSWQYAFTVDSKIGSKKLLENIASASPYIPRFNNMGDFIFTEIPMDGQPVSPATVQTIEEADCISFSFSRSKIESVFTKIVFKWNWDYAREEFNDSVTADIEEILEGYDLDYYGFDEPVELIIDGEQGKYIRSETTAQKFAEWYLLWSCNQKLQIKIRLPLKMMFLEIGDFVDFGNELLGGIAPYGIDYTADGDLNGQEIFKNFLITSTNKTLEWVEIEAIMLHNLDTTFVYTTFQANIYYPVIASDGLNGILINNIRDYLPLNRVIAQSGQASWNYGGFWQYFGEWNESTTLVGGATYMIRFEETTTTNLFKLK